MTCFLCCCFPSSIKTSYAQLSDNDDSRVSSPTSTRGARTQRTASKYVDLADQIKREKVNRIPQLTKTTKKIAESEPVKQLQDGP